MASLPNVTEFPERDTRCSSNDSGRSGLAGLFDRDPYTFSRILAGISMAGAIYPSVAATVFYVAGLVVELHRIHLSMGDSEFLLEMLAAIPWMIVTVGFGGGVVGLLYAATTSIFILPLVYLCLFTLKLRVNSTWLGAFCGGLVGFFTATLLIVIMLDEFGRDWSDLLITAAIGPGLSTPVGQIGGAWGGSRENRNRGAAKRERELEPASSRFQFDLRQLLWFSTWVGLLLAGLRLVGLPFELMLPLLAGWLVYQSATLAIGWLVICRLWPRWRARRARRFT